MYNPADRASPMLLGLHHVALIVSDVARALAFYREAFALAEIPRLSSGISAHRGAWLRLGPLELHLQERPGHTPKTEQHLALLTDRFDELVARIPELGGRIEEAKLIEGMAKRCFAYDADGNRIELLQRA